MKINMNDWVKVKLTDIGRQELYRQHAELREAFPKLRVSVHKEEDDQGYVKFQLWDLMQTFGHLMVLGADLPFEVNIVVGEV